jgi:hypothetical protein
MKLVRVASAVQQDGIEAGFAADFDSSGGVISCENAITVASEDFSGISQSERVVIKTKDRRHIGLPVALVRDVECGAAPV